MNQPLWVSKQPFRDPAQIAGFECGRASVDQWLHGKALAAHPNVSTTLYTGATGNVVGFAAVTMAVLVVADATSAQRTGSRGGMSVGYMLAQMGVHAAESGRGVGRAVVRDSMLSAARAYGEAPFPLFVVDAADELLAGYYEELGLRRLPNQLRLATPMRRVIKILG
jgi:GNAT superfamily N-acetyltransferase